MAWEAAKTATALAVAGMLMVGGLFAICGLAIIAGKVACSLTQRLNVWQSCLAAAIVAVVLMWVVVFAATWCCGVPIP